jgi:ABC-type uncharacterized transport system involved in gliding motility auxiliary subunit
MKKIGKFGKYLFIPGIILLIGGLVAGFVTNKWTNLYIGLIVAGVVILVVWLIFFNSFLRRFWQVRSTKVGARILVTTVIVLGILGLINLGAVRYSKRIDFSENQLFTLSPQSQEIVTNLKQPLKIWIFDRQLDPANKELLHTYRNYNSKLQFELVDPTKKLGIVQKFKGKSAKIEPGDVYVEYKQKKQLVENLQNLQNENLQEKISESKLTNAIEKIQRDRILTVYFLQGHGELTLNDEEGGLSQAITSLKDKGYQVETLNLAQRPEIPQNANVIVIAGAQRQLFAAEVKALKDYSERGGNLLLMVDPDDNSGLENLLKEWGVQLDPRVVIDASGAGNLLGFNPATPIITQYGNHPITKDFKGGYSVYPFARPIGTVKVKEVEATALLVASNQMWGESNLDSEEAEFQPNTDLAPPFDLGVALTRIIEQKSAEKEKVSPTTTPSPSPTSTSESPQANSKNTTSKNTPIPSPSPSDTKKAEKTEAKMVVIGNSTFAANGWFNQQLNGDVFLNSVQWLATEDEQPLSIRPKEPKNRRVKLTPLQAEMIAWMSLGIFPLLGFLLAGITWWRKR